MILEVTVLMLSGRQIGGRLQVSEAALQVLMADRDGMFRLGGREVWVRFVQDYHYRVITAQDV